MSLRDITHNLRMEVSDLEQIADERRKKVDANPKLKKLLGQIIALFGSKGMDPMRTEAERTLTYKLLNWDIFNDAGLYAAVGTPDGKLRVEVFVSPIEKRAISLTGTNVNPESARAYAAAVVQACDFHTKAVALLSEWSAEFKKAFPKS